MVDPLNATDEDEDGSVKTLSNSSDSVDELAQTYQASARDSSTSWAARAHPTALQSQFQELVAIDLQHQTSIDTIEAAAATPGGQGSLERLHDAPIGAPVGNTNYVQSGGIVIEKNLHKRTVVQSKLNNLKLIIEERFAASSINHGYIFRRQYQGAFISKTGLKPRIKGQMSIK